MDKETRNELRNLRKKIRTRRNKFRKQIAPFRAKINEILGKKPKVKTPEVAIVPSEIEQTPMHQLIEKKEEVKGDESE